MGLSYTPETNDLSNILNSRLPATRYEYHDLVTCPYNFVYYLRCTQAGTTSNNTIDTKDVTDGMPIQDGGVMWEVISIKRMIEEYLPKINHNFMVKGTPWVGIIQDRIRSTGGNLTYPDGSTVAHQRGGQGGRASTWMYRRLNTHGVEEYFIPDYFTRINDYTNDDYITKIFDQTLPYKYMRRINIPMTATTPMPNGICAMKNAAMDLPDGTKALFSENDGSPDWNGQFTNAKSWDAKEVNTWVPIKKTYYIDCDFDIWDPVTDKPIGSRKKLRAVGGEPFTIDLKKYYPNCKKIKVYDEFTAAVNNAKGSKVLPEYVVGETTIGAVLHPAFLDYHAKGTKNGDGSYTITSLTQTEQSTPVEYEWRWYSAYQTCRRTRQTSTLTRSQYYLGSAPMQPPNHAYNHGGNKDGECRPLAAPQAESTNNSINYRYCDYWLMHLLYIMRIIESGRECTYTGSNPYNGHTDKWATHAYYIGGWYDGNRWNQYQPGYAKWTGITYEWGSKSGTVTYYCYDTSDNKSNPDGRVSENSWRGIESFPNGFVWNYIEDMLVNPQQVIHVHLPHNWNTVPNHNNLTGYINTGLQNTHTDHAIDQRFSGSCIPNSKTTSADVSQGYKYSSNSSTVYGIYVFGGRNNSDEVGFSWNSNNEATNVNVNYGSSLYFYPQEDITQ